MLFTKFFFFPLLFSHVCCIFVLTHWNYYRSLAMVTQASCSGVRPGHTIASLRSLRWIDALVDWATPFKFSTPPVEDLRNILHKGSVNSK